MIANKVDDVHEDVKKILAKTQRSATLPSSDTVVQQMPLKPAVFHGRDVIIEEITQLLTKEETSRVFSAQVGWERLQLHWALSDNLSLRHGFYLKTLSGYLALKRRRKTGGHCFGRSYTF